MDQKIKHHCTLPVANVTLDVVFLQFSDDIYMVVVQVVVVAVVVKKWNLVKCEMENILSSLCFRVFLCLE